MVAYLSVQSGPDTGKHFVLDPDRPMHLGRGSSCEIMLSDPVSSRFHAVVYFEDGNWQLRDTSSRNGTFVNGQKAEHARLLDKSLVKIGATELRLVEPPSSGLVGDGETFPTIVQDVTMADGNGDEVDPLMRLAHTGHVFDLYLLSLNLLRTNHTEGAIDSTLQLLRDRTKADAVGLSFDSGDGRQKPQRVVPPEFTEKVQLSRSLIRRVIGKGKAIWINDQWDPNDSVSDVRAQADPKWSDAIYVPLDDGNNNLGVLHLYRKDPSFACRNSS